MIVELLEKSVITDEQKLAEKRSTILAELEKVIEPYSNMNDVFTQLCMRHCENYIDAKLLSPAVTVLDKQANDGAQLRESLNKVLDVESKLLVQLAEYRDNFSKFKDDVRSMFASLERSTMVGLVAAAPPCPLTPPTLHRSVYSTEAEVRLEETATRKGVYYDSTFQVHLSRCLGELRRHYHKRITILFNHECANAAREGRSARWADRFEVIDSLGLGQVFHDIVFRLYPRVA